MNCLINDIIKWAKTKEAGAEVIRRYLRLKYRMNIDLKSLERRMQHSDLKTA